MNIFSIITKFLLVCLIFWAQKTFAQGGYQLMYGVPLDSGPDPSASPTSSVPAISVTPPVAPNNPPIVAHHVLREITIAPDSTAISLRDVIYSMGLNFLSFMAILFGLIIFQIVGYRWYMKHVGPKKWVWWLAYAPILAALIWISAIIGIVLGNRFLY
jgi:hypothetical protein